jgi:hypothetical protein
MLQEQGLGNCLLLLSDGQMGQIVRWLACQMVRCFTIAEIHHPQPLLLVNRNRRSWRDRAAFRRLAADQSLHTDKGTVNFMGAAIAVF